ncbi:MAG: sugar porter family MFS transporter [Phycisphaerae bacterium]
MSIGVKNSGTSSSGEVIPGLGPIIFAALTVSLAGFLFGYDTGVQAGVQGYLKIYFHLSAFGKGFAIACLDLGCIAGAAAGGFMADRFGRKKILILCAILFALSGILSAIPQYMWELVLARLIGGLALGSSSMIAPVYISEIAPEQHRGRLAALFQLGIVVGIFLVYWVNYGIVNFGAGIHGAAHSGMMNWNEQFGWRWMLGSETLPAVLFLILLAGIKESPRWLIVNDREPEAKNILERFFGSAKAQREIEAVKAVAAQEEGHLSELFAPRYRLPLIVALFLAVFSQFSGINSIIYYAPSVFGAAGMKTTNAFSSTVLVGTVNLLFTFIAIAYVDKAGRKLLLAIGTAIQVVALASVGLIFAITGRQPGFKESNGLLQFQGARSHTQFVALAAKMHASIALLPDFTHTQVVILIVSVLVFIAAFAMAMGPMPWIIISEIFPARIRGRAAALGVLTLWAAIFIVALTFPWLKAHAGLTVTYFIYSGCSFISFLFVVLVLPETKGKTLEQIEAYWHHRHENKMRQE